MKTLQHYKPYQCQFHSPIVLTANILPVFHKVDSQFVHCYSNIKNPPQTLHFCVHYAFSLSVLDCTHHNCAILVQKQTKIPHFLVFTQQGVAIYLTSHRPLQIVFCDHKVVFANANVIFQQTPNHLSHIKYSEHEIQLNCTFTILLYWSALVQFT